HEPFGVRSALLAPSKLALDFLLNVIQKIQNRRSLRDKRVASGDAASRQAVMRVNVDQAPKRPPWAPIRQLSGEGCHRWRPGDRLEWDERRAICPSEPTGVMTTACLKEEIDRNTGNPKR